MEARDWQANAAACRLLALSLQYPDEGLAELVFDGRWLDAVHEVAEACAWKDDVAIQHASLLESKEGVRASSAAELLHVFRNEATRLFVGTPRPIVTPYEGVWFSEKAGKPTLLFVSKRSMDVEHFAKRCGLGQPEGTNEPFDHVATEFEMLQYLASLAAGFEVAPHEQIPDFLADGGAANAYSEFLSDHVSAWVPEFADKLAAESRIPFYRHVAELLKTFVATCL